MTQHFVLVKQHPETQRIARRKPQPRQTLTPVFTLPKAQQLAAPQQAFSTGGSFLQLLGTAFAVGGIVLGFVLRGWAGFGVFALCALVGLLLAFWGSFIIDGKLP